MGFVLFTKDSNIPYYVEQTSKRPPDLRPVAVYSNLFQSVLGHFNYLA